nr:MAG TPA: hypothetical protein [Caudoviricetes sp.]DAK94882.1 MAG TPA: hypothetical protein [Caudoviricetes sp.]
MSKSCRDCLFRDFPSHTNFCPHPQQRKPDGSFVCTHWEWRYQ